MKIVQRLILTAIVISSGVVVYGAVRLPGVFSDHMVLQRRGRAGVGDRGTGRADRRQARRSEENG